MPATEPQPTSSTHPYTCLACNLAFTTASLQRTHYTTDLHRYNSKRKVAGLAPVTAETFDAKIRENRGGEAVDGEQGTEEGSASGSGRRCEACGKSFASEGAEKSHLQSKKHRETVFKGAITAINGSPSPRKPKQTPSEPALPSAADATTAAPVATSSSAAMQDVTFESDAEALDALIELRLESAPRIPLLSCLFCPHASQNLDDKISHMFLKHGFFIPDREYLADPEGLMGYLGEGVSVWNVCVYCSAGFGGRVEEGKSKEEQGVMARKGLERVRKHMIDKVRSPPHLASLNHRTDETIRLQSHCKLAWDTEAQRLEVSDYYDFRPSYPDYVKKASKGKKKSSKADDGWEDVSDEEMVDVDPDAEVEVIMEDSDSDADSEGTLDDEDATNGFSFGDSPFELVLPSGRRIGHRALRHVYKQNVLPYTVGGEMTGNGSRNGQLITRLALASSSSDSDKPTSSHSSLTAERLRIAAQRGSLHSASLVPARGGLGAYGQGKEVVKARNRGEAKEAGRHVREHRDAKRQELFRTKVGMSSGNNQKHCECDACRVGGEKGSLLMRFLSFPSTSQTATRCCSDGSALDVVRRLSSDPVGDRTHWGGRTSRSMCHGVVSPCGPPKSSTLVLALPCKKPLSHSPLSLATPESRPDLLGRDRISSVERGLQRDARQLSQEEAAAVRAPHIFASNAVASSSPPSSSSSPLPAPRSAPP